MARPLAVLLLALLAASCLAPRADAASCALPPCAAASSPCLSSNWTAAQQCMTAIPFRDDWRNATVATLLAALENYGLRDIVLNAGPPYYTRSDVVAAVAATRSRAYTTDVDFQEDIQTALASPQDAHTRYSKPVCYDATLVLPFVLNASLNVALPAPAAVMRLTLEASTLLANYSALFPAVNVSGALGREVALIDGVEAVTAIAAWADAFETRSNDPAIRFNAALRSFMFRSQRSLPRPAAAGGVVFTLVDGTSVQLPWLVSYTASFGNSNACAAPTAASLASSSSFSSQSASAPSRLGADLHAPPLHAPTLAAAAGSGNRATVIAPGASNSSISCFLQTTAGDKTTLVMKVGSFSPPGADYLAAWRHFVDDAITCLSAPGFEALVVDVMQNGGGYVCLGLRLLTLIFSRFDLDHSQVLMKYDLPHSAFMDNYINTANEPNPYINAMDVEEILNPATMLPFPDGKSYYYPGATVVQGGRASRRSNPFVLDCRAAFAMRADFRAPAALAVGRQRVSIVSDGTCGSTCASFAKIAQEAGVATMVGLGGVWHQPMDVASFAGGFVCNARYLQVMANLSGGPAFPQFPTSSAWQFDWAVWYSRVQPQRPAQFTQQAPDVRMPFWAFPHVSVPIAVSTALVSALYDQTVAASLARIAAAEGGASDPGGIFSNAWRVAAIVLMIVLVATVAGFVWYWRSAKEGLDGIVLRQAEYGSVE